MPTHAMPDELYELRRRIEQMQAKLDDRAERLKKLGDENALLRKMTSYLQRDTDRLVGAVMHSTMTALNELPSENLRLNVGINTTAANFLAQGFNSAQRVIEVFGLNPAGPMLDWGCGSGRTLNWLLPQGNWKHVWNGCDVDEEAIDWLRKRGISSAEKCSDIPPLPYPDEYFEGVYAFSVLTHIHPKQHRSWYEEVFRVLKPRGLALLTTQGDAVLASNRVADTQAIKRYAEVGWCDIEQPGHYKNASLVSPKFTTDLIGEYFDLVDYTAGGYQALMDQIIVRKKASS